ncbi:MAG: homocysteine S-methyltransferase family protein [Candidatus Margulisiibacteriota bacterium]
MTIFNDKKIYVIDGAMGTQIMKKGVVPGTCFEELNIKEPGIIESIHRSYLESGADIIETNTFGGTRTKLLSYGLQDKFHKINFDGVRIAKKAAVGKALVAASMGPCGHLMEPIGDFSFDAAYVEFAAQAKVFEEAGADLISIETMSDLQEARAALIAVKQNTLLPVIVHLTYDGNGKTITGTPPEVAIAVLTALGADAIGANCSTGPKDMVVLAGFLAKHSGVPVSIMPNAGSPEIVDDETVYRMTPEKFAFYAKKILSCGVKFIGGCCGTGPEHIRAIANLKLQITNWEKREKGIKKTTILTSRTKVLEIGKNKKIVIIGERINPTNKRNFQAELKAGKMNILRQEAVSQVASGAGLLDINVGAPDIDEVAAMKKAVLAAQAAVDVPLCIDSSNPAALEAGLKNFPGRALVNSVNGKDESVDTVLPLVKKYGATVIALTLEKGIPTTAQDRITVAEKILKKAASLGIGRKDIFVDVLTLSAGAQQEGVGETFKALSLCRTRLMVKTVLGVSNVSHGLPGRKALNAAFLKMAAAKGLSAAIYNPENLSVRISAEQLRDAKNVFLDKDKGAKKWIEKYSGKNAGRSDASKKENGHAGSLPEKIFDTVVEGNLENVTELVEEGLKKHPPQMLIDKTLLPAMEEVGKRFNSGDYFIPQVMASAETMKKAFNRIKSEIKPGDRKDLGTVVIATVMGDIHDIGKNIVAMLLENHGFNVVDLGKDVSPEMIVSTAKERKADIIMLSALLTTTMPQMKKVKQALEKEGLSIPVIVGGAPVTSNFAKGFGANFAKDAVAAVEEAKKVSKK